MIPTKQSFQQTLNLKSAKSDQIHLIKSMLDSFKLVVHIWQSITTVSKI